MIRVMNSSLNCSQPFINIIVLLPGHRESLTPNILMLTSWEGKEQNTPSDDGARSFPPS